MNSESKLKLIRFAVLIAILALLGSGTSFAAASSLPGDALYPVKLNVNEKVAAAFRLSAEDKAKFEARLAERRLEEANELAVEGRLTTEASAKIEESFQAFSDRVEARIEELRKNGDDEAADAVSARFEAALQAHARALAAIQARFDADTNATSTSSGSDNSGRGKSDGIVKLSIPLREIIMGVQKNNLKAESKATSSVSASAEVAADVRIAAAIEAIEDARELLAKKSAQVGPEVSAKADAELDVADALVIQAKAKADADANVEAVKLANRAAWIGNQVRVLLNLQANISAKADASFGSNGPRLDLFGNSGPGSRDKQEDNHRNDQEVDRGSDDNGQRNGDDNDNRGSNSSGNDDDSNDKLDEFRERVNLLPPAAIGL